jgi:hypothetical protein
MLSTPASTKITRRNALQIGFHTFGGSIAGAGKLR